MPSRRHRALSVVVMSAALGARVEAQTGLDSLTHVRAGVSARASSTSPDPNSNGDNRWVKPGETFTLAALAGSGVIRHIWMTFAEPGPSWISKVGAADHSETVLRM